MQRLEISGAVRPIYGSLGVKRLRHKTGYWDTHVLSSSSNFSFRTRRKCFTKIW